MDIRQETYKTEFKAVLNDKFEKEAVAFLNSPIGGEVYIGIEDDGKVIGVKDPDNVQLRIAERLRDAISPSTLGLATITTESAEGKWVIRVSIASGTEKPYYLTKYGMSPQGCFLRVGSSVQSIPKERIVAMYSRRMPKSIMDIPSRRQDLTFVQLKIYYEGMRLTLNDRFAKSLGLLTQDGTYNLLAYLLSDNNTISVSVAKYRGTDKCDLIERQECGLCSIIKSVHMVLDRLKVENIVKTKITPTTRIEVPLVDPTSLREAVTNAFVHTDWQYENAPVFEVFSDRISITSTGTLPDNLSKEDFFNCVSVPRNRELMRIFKDLDMVEQLGSGLSRIKAHYDLHIYRFMDGFIRVDFPFNTADILKAGGNQAAVGGNQAATGGNQAAAGGNQAAVGGNQAAAGGNQAAAGGNRKSKETNTRGQVVDALKSHPNISVPELLVVTQIPQRTLERILSQLKKEGIVKRSGTTRKSSWKVLD